MLRGALSGEVKADAPAVRAGREVRFGLVLYGGVSLAVYIYGVAYEFQRLVRASEGVEENAWTEVLNAVGAAATVDIVSGASAGGVNGVLLSKALAGGADMDAIRPIWIDDAGFGELLQEAGEKEPQSLLSSRRFRELLDDGLERMDAANSLRRPLAPALDLFIAATRLRPWVREFRTDLGGLLRTRDYRKSFHLKLRRSGYNEARPELGYDRDDFAPAQNAVLADIAQASSAFPAAFEPLEMAVDARNERFFAEGEPNPSHLSDGGILHNKPFTETISTIMTRAAARPVSRWLVSVEPDPEQVVHPAPDEDPPEVTEVVSKAAIGIPRYQSIAADLARLDEHREWAAEAREKLGEIDESLLAGIERRRLGTEMGGDRGAPGGEDAVRAWRDQVLEASDYLEQRRRRFLAMLGRRLSAGAEEAERATVASWIEEGLEVEDVDLSDEADPGFERRRVYRLLEMTSRLRAERELGAALREQVVEARIELWAQFDRLDQLLWELFEAGGARDRARVVSAYERRDLGALLEVVTPIVRRLESELTPVRSGVRAACEALDEVWGPVHSRVSSRFATVFDWFELWDAQLLTIDELGGVWARDEIRFARISPADTFLIGKAPSAKLAGDQLGHFGGFLKREWRRNDLLWGRLDAAEVITRMLMKGSGRENDQALRELAGRVHEEIAARELPNLDGDYRHHLENEYDVGEETLADVAMRERANLVLRTAEVTRNLLRTVHESEGPAPLRRLFAWLGTGAGLLLFFVRWPVRAVWGEDRAVRRFVRLAILFVGLWSLLSLLLVVLGIIGETSTLWALIGGALAVFALWSVLEALTR